MWLGSITETQVSELEEIFATYTENGDWVIPEWLRYLKDQVTLRDYGPDTKY